MKHELYMSNIIRIVQDHETEASPSFNVRIEISIKENAFSFFLFPPRRPRPPSIFLKQDKIKKTKREIKGRAKSRSKENGEKGNKGGRGMRRGIENFFTRDEEERW